MAYDDCTIIRVRHRINQPVHLIEYQTWPELLLVVIYFNLCIKYVYIYIGLIVKYFIL